MNEIQQRRRNAHYNTVTEETSVRHTGGKIFIQLIICMALILCTFHFRTYPFPTGETLHGLIQDITTRNSNISAPVTQLREFIAEKAGPILLPDPGDNSVFNESTPTKLAEH